jgi:hypothetical protein
VTNPTRLYGLELIDCAKANSNQGIEVAAEHCGYGQDIPSFEQELRQACDRIGITIQDFSDLTSVHRNDEKGIVIAPDSDTQL